MEKEVEDLKLSAMTGDRLKTYAEKHGINLEEGSTKDAILERIKSEQDK